MTKIVKKPWGEEMWIADGVDMPYALKRIFFKAGNKTSIQVHKLKHETNYVLSGTGLLMLSDLFLDVDKYHELTKSDINRYIASMKIIKLNPGDIFHVTPGHVHRVIAIEDLVFMEASSPELDDVIRLEDDTNRGNGRIESEHE